MRKQTKLIIARAQREGLLVHVSVWITQSLCTVGRIDHFGIPVNITVVSHLLFWGVRHYMASRSNQKAIPTVFLPHVSWHQSTEQTLLHALEFLISMQFSLHQNYKPVSLLLNSINSLKKIKSCSCCCGKTPAHVIFFSCIMSAMSSWYANSDTLYIWIEGSFIQMMLSAHKRTTNVAGVSKWVYRFVKWLFLESSDTWAKHFGLL